jgi:hypothetical protein
MRFAILEMKLTLAKVLSKFDVVASKNTLEKLIFTEGTVRRPENGIKIMIQKRDNILNF